MTVSDMSAFPRAAEKRRSGSWDIFITIRWAAAALEPEQIRSASRGSGAAAKRTLLRYQEMNPDGSAGGCVSLEAA